MRWLLPDPQDVVQEHLAQGTWYEAQELEAIQQIIKPQSVMVDIGANIGNHAVFFDKCCDSQRVIVFEPLQEAYVPLLANLAINYCHKTCVDHLGMALGAHAGMCDISCRFGHNLGATQLALTPQGKIPVITGDSVLAHEQVDFIKVDVEGWEMSVLQGLAHTIHKHRPIMFIEVQSVNKHLFPDFLSEFNYDVTHEWPVAGIYVNLIVQPKQMV